MTWKISGLPEVARGYRVIPPQSIKRMLVVLLPKGEYDASSGSGFSEGGARMTVQRKHMERATGICAGGGSISHPRSMFQP